MRMPARTRPVLPSRRRGVEFSAQYHPLPWIEFNTDLALSRARYRGDLAAVDLDGPWIANAPRFIGSFGVLVNDLGAWFGGLQWRRLGPYPIMRRPAFPEDSGYSEFNLDAGYKLNSNLKLQLSLYNLFNTHANSSAYSYTTRLPGEPRPGLMACRSIALEPFSGLLKLPCTLRPGQPATAAPNPAAAPATAGREPCCRC